LTIPFFHGRTFWLLIGFNVIVYAFLIRRLAVVSRALGEARYGARICVVCLPLAVISVPEWSPILFVPYLLVLIYALDLAVHGWKPNRLAGAMYGVIFAAFMLVKMTFIPLILPVVVLCAIAQFRHGVLPRTLAVFLVALPLLWMGFSQSLGNIPAFVAGSAEIVAGYKDEMEYWELPAIWSMMFLVIAYAMLWSAATIAAWRRFGGWTGLVSGVSLVLVFYAGLLNGFVRGDSYHVLPCVLTAFGIWGLVDLLIARGGMRRRSGLIPVSWLAFGMILFALSYEWRMSGGDVAHANLKQIADRPKALVRLVLKGTKPLEATTLALDNNLRSQAVPSLKGRTVDVPNGDPGIAFVSGARLRLRPTITAYSGYTPALTRANANYLEGERGPRFVLLMHPFAIDGKFPTTEDPSAWRSLLTHYEHSLCSGAYEVFQRRPVPLAARLAPLMTRTVGFDEELEVPRGSSRAIWAEIEIDPTIAGKCVSLAFKPMPVYMITKLANGGEATHRINARMAKTGFLLSPYLGDPATLRALFADDRDGCEPRAVRSIRLGGTFQGEGWSTNLELKNFYQEKIKVRLFDLVLETAVASRDHARYQGVAHASSWGTAASNSSTD
jgi:hypothetical protein